MNSRRSGFTLVELLIVIVVIAILAAISVVAYNGIQTRARNTTLQSDLRNAATQLGIDNAYDGAYPSGPTVPSNLVTSPTNSFQYTSDGTTFCLTITSSSSGTNTYHIDQAGVIQEGACPGHIAGGLGSSGWAAITAGIYHSCGVKNGVAYCWGDNGYGQLGDGTTTSSSVPVAVDTSSMSDPVLAISAGDRHTCASTANRVYCWGNNANGQLGNGTVANSSSPTAVVNTLMTGAIERITAGTVHSCAATNSGAYCWGNNSYGQLGDGTTSGSLVPVAVTNTLMSGAVVAIDAGSTHTCAATSSGAYCWGRNANGQLGNGSTADSAVPVAVTNTLMSGAITAISTSYYHTCAATSSGAYCWGYNNLGQLGNGSTTTSTTPVAVTNTLMSGTITALTAGYSHTCAATSTGAYCWGSSYNLGNTGGVNSSTPVAVTNTLMSGTVLAVSSLYTHTCAITAADAYCWGYNDYGRLGDGTTTFSWDPVVVSPTP